jgi:hypothetical protein
LWWGSLWAAIPRRLSLRVPRRAGGYCCRPADPKKMTAIEDHGRVSSEGEHELAGQPTCQRDRARPSGLQGTIGRAGAISYSYAGASNRIYLK